MFGHSDSPESILPRLEEKIESYYLKHEIKCFYVGNRGWFDRLAATAVKRLKTKYPDIKLYLVLAYHPGERAVHLTKGFDASYYPPLENVPRSFAIVRANRYMVETAEAVICDVCHVGNTKKLLEYARRRQKTGRLILENVAE